MRIAIAVVVLVAASGCSQHVKSENEALKAKVAALEAQVAQLRAEAERSKPVSFNGTVLSPPLLNALSMSLAPVPTRQPFTEPRTWSTAAGTGTLTYYGQIDARELGVRNVTTTKHSATAPRPLRKQGEDLLDNSNGALDHLNATVNLQKSGSSTRATPTSTTPVSRP